MSQGTADGMAVGRVGAAACRGAGGAAAGSVLRAEIEFSSIWLSEAHLGMHSKEQAISELSTVNDLQGILDVRKQLVGIDARRTGAEWMLTMM